MKFLKQGDYFVSEAVRHGLGDLLVEILIAAGRVGGQHHGLGVVRFRTAARITSCWLDSTTLFTSLMFVTHGLPDS